MKNIFSSRIGIIVVGAAIGSIAALLQKAGNPPNMGICVACFERDIAGALGLHRASVVQYIRPEIPGFVLGSFLIALLTKEYSPRSGSSPAIRFFLGIFAMIGALVFLGCPWRALLRLAGGDLNAIVGLAGLATGIGAGVFFLKRGFSLGRSYKNPAAAGVIFPLFMVALLAFLVTKFSAAENGAIFFSAKGPGAMHASVIISIIAGLVIGGLAQRSRFCTMGAIRDVILIRDFHLFSGILSLVVFAFIINLIVGQFNPGFTGQPIAHDNHLWNFLGMVLAGVSFTLAGGCPGRQLILAGEGDNDSAVFALGMIVGAGFSHNFMLASSPAGPGAYGPASVIIGLVVVFAIGFFMRENISQGG